MGIGVGIFEIEFRGQRDDLLDLADVAFEDFDAGFGVQVPEAHGAVVGGGEDGAGGRINFDVVDPVGVTAKDKGGFVLEIPDFHSFIARARCENGGVKMQG